MSASSKNLEISSIPKLFRRCFEILPGFLTWSLLIGFLVVSFYQPLMAAYFLIAFDLFWLTKSATIAARLVQGYARLNQMNMISWSARLNHLRDIDKSIASNKLEIKKLNRYKDFSLHYEGSRYIRFIERLKSRKDTVLDPDIVYNAVIIAAYNESEDILRPTLQSLLDSDYDASKLIVILAYEERGGELIQETAQKLESEYKNKFAHMVAVCHPKDIKDEVKGKGPNITYAGKFLHSYIKEHDIPADNVIVTTLDADNRPSSQYFSYLTFVFCSSPSRLKQSYQPVAMFYNNIWDAPAAMRVVAAGNSFWNISLSMRPHLIRNFSAHAQSLSALVETEFWSKETIVEDGHQFWRSYFTFGKDYEVVPLYVPIYQDAVLASTYWRTIIVQFKQIRRWAWGASDIAYVAYYGLKDRSIGFADKLTKFLRLLESHVTWAAAPLILAFMAWAPLFLNPEANQNIVVHQLPIVVSRIQTVTMAGLFITIVISIISLPPRPKHYRKGRVLLMVGQWMLFPITTLVFGALAALNAQTRLMFARYIEEFEVTEKAVKKYDK